MGEQSLRLRVSPEGEAEKDLALLWVGLFLAVRTFLLLSLLLPLRNRIGLNEVPHRPDYGITQGYISMVGNGLKYVFFVRGNADCHDPVASFWRGRRAL